MEKKAVPFGPERWEPEIRDRYRARTHHQFILHQNVFDYVKPRDGPPEFLVQYLLGRVNGWLEEGTAAKPVVPALVSEKGPLPGFTPDKGTDTAALEKGGPTGPLPGKGSAGAVAGPAAVPGDSFLDGPLDDQGRFDIKIIFSQSQGLELIEEQLPSGKMSDMEAIFRKIAQISNEAPLPRTAPEALPLLGRVLGQEKHRALVIIEYLEKIAPASRSVQSANTPILIESLHRWGHDPLVRRRRHLILMVTYNLGQVDESLYAANSGCYPVAIPLPNAEERQAFLEYIRDEYPCGLSCLDMEMNISSLARNTTGFSLRALDETNRLAGERHSPITWTTIRDRKKEIIQAESEGLLEIVEPAHSFAQVGGLGKVRHYLQQVAERFKEDRKSPVVPKGLLFVGPPGVGKTHIAQAFARESAMNFVLMRNVRSKWVGESERNLTRVFNLARSIAPVCIFVDEIDQAIGSRSEVAGDSGVSQRIFGRILEEMGNNENRGEILWICATNRPDLLDVAMLSRFDRVIPFLPPDAQERAEILAALSSYLGIDFSSDVDLAHTAAVRGLIGLTGREIEIILRRALEIAGGKTVSPAVLGEAISDFKPVYDQRQYLLQSLLALRATNLRPFLPESLKEYLGQKEVNIWGDNGEVDVDKLESEIGRLRPFGRF